ncbi:hypothetical protein ABFT80_26915 [Mesorhizobium sp. SB112]|uniref:hypothetical protein n=1 Tax=Mesorhizobium sp. SB112 TaxID=3151853 RepID=UPI0032632F7F
MGVEHEWHSWPWAVATALVLAVLVAEIVRSLSHGDVGLDSDAALSMSAASRLARCWRAMSSR